MDQQIIRSLNGTAGPEEIAEVMRWRAESTENEARYQEFARIWSATERPEEINGMRPPDASRIISIAERRASGARRAAGAAGHLMRAAMFAAAFLGGLAAGQFLLLTPDPLAALEISTGPNELSTARLSDGTTVRLAPNSSLWVERDANGRSVRLQGRAFFSVAEDPSAPFVVRTDAGEATVLGTRFQIDAKPDNLHVLVVEGRVRMATGSGSVEIGVGQSGRASRGSRPVLEDVPQMQPELAWMAGVLVFNGTPIRRVASEIEERYGVRFPIPDGPIGDRSVSATFTIEDLPTVVSIVCRVVDIRCSLEGSEVTVVE